jgi:hypothetical protein
MLAGLVNSGRFEIGLLNFDGNADPLYAFVRPEFYDRVSIKTLEDKLRDDGKRISVSGEPTAFRDGLRALDHWVDDDGRDWGAVKDWLGGPGSFDAPARVLVCDTMTSMGEAAFRRRRFVRPAGSKADDTDSDWGAAMRDEAYFMEILAQERYNCHVIVNAHLKFIEPRVPRGDKNESMDMKEARTKLFLNKAETVGGRWCPSALGQALPPEVARFFPSVVLIEERLGKRLIITGGEEGYTLGVPAKGIKKSYPIETGLVQVIDAILGAEGEEDGNG